MKQGVLTLKESEHMFESIAEDELALEQARKNQVSLFLHIHANVFLKRFSIYSCNTLRKQVF